MVRGPGARYAAGIPRTAGRDTEGGGSALITIILILLVAALLLGFGLGPVLAAVFHNRPRNRE